MDDATVIVRKAGAVVVAALRGDYDISNASAVRKRLVDVLRQRPAGLVIDLGDVSFCDLACLRALATLRCRAEALGAWVRLAAPSPVVSRMLELTGLGASLPAYCDVEQALRASHHRIPHPSGSRHLLAV